MVSWIQSQLSQSTLPSRISEGDVVLLDDIDDSEVVTRALYVRPHLMEKKNVFDEFLASGRLKQLYIAGPPGCGKTVFIALLARMYAHNENKNVLYVANRKGQQCPIFSFRGSNNAQQLELFPANRKLYSVLEEVLTHSSEYDLVVYDGVRMGIGDSEDCVGLLNASIGRKPTKAVFVKSFPFLIRAGDLLADFLLVHTFDSWESASVYVDAICAMKEANLMGSMLEQDIRDHAILSDEEQDIPQDATSIALTRETIESYVEFKYHYAGGSARFMFDLDVPHLLTELNERVGALKYEHWKEFCYCYLAAATNEAVIFLMQRFHDENGKATVTGVSKFVIMTAYDRCGSKVAEAVSAAAEATGNRSLGALAFELTQLEIIKGALTSAANTGYVMTDCGIVFKPTHEVHYDGINLQQEVQKDGTTVIWCLKWDQDCFDVALYCKGTLATIQFVVSDNHSLKLHYVRQLREELNRDHPRVREVVHIGINESGVVRWKAPTGTGKSHCEIDFTVHVCASSPLEDWEEGSPLEDWEEASPLEYGEEGLGAQQDVVDCLVPTNRATVEKVEMHGKKRKEPCPGLP